MAEFHKNASMIQKDLERNPYYSYYAIEDIIRDGMKEPLIKRGTRIDRKKIAAIVRALGDIVVNYSDVKLKDVQAQRRAHVTRADWLSIEEAIRTRMKGTPDAKWGFPILDIDVLLDIIDELEDTGPPELIKLMAIAQEKDYRLFIHSSMCGLISGAMAIVLHDQRKGVKLEPGKNAFLNNEIFQVASGGFLHRVGSWIKDGELKISKVHEKQLESWVKANSADKAAMITEAYRGFLFIISKKVFSTVTAHILLSMNENMDGSGFPEGKKGEEIHEYSRIVSVANRFCELWASFEDEYIETKQQLKLTLSALLKGAYKDTDGTLKHKELDYSMIGVLLELLK